MQKFQRSFAPYAILPWTQQYNSLMTLGHRCPNLTSRGIQGGSSPPSKLLSPGDAPEWAILPGDLPATWATLNTKGLYGNYRCPPMDSSAVRSARPPPLLRQFPIHGSSRLAWPGTVNGPSNLCRIGGTRSFGKGGRDQYDTSISVHQSGYQRLEAR